MMIGDYQIANSNALANGEVPLYGSIANCDLVMHGSSLFANGEWSQYD
jgi:hypothetical protein